MEKLKETLRLKEEEMNEKESTYRALQEANDALHVQSKEYEANCDEYVARIQAMEEQNTNEHNENTQHIKRYEERIDGLRKEIQSKIDEIERHIENGDTRFILFVLCLCFWY
eukprot:909607_1